MTVSATQMNPCVTRSFVNPGSAARSIDTNWERGYRGLSLKTSSANHWLYTSPRSGLLYEDLSEGQRGLLDCVCFGRLCILAELLIQNSWFISATNHTVYRGILRAYSSASQTQKVVILAQILDAIFSTSTVTSFAL